MNPKLKTLLLIVGPIFLILIWVMGFFALTKGGKKANTGANILASGEKTTIQTSSKNNIPSIKNTQKDNINQNEITVYMPNVFYGLEGKNTGLDKLDKKIETEKVHSDSKKNDTIRYKTFSTISEYKNFLAKNINNLTGEIYLIPSIWADDFIDKAQNFRIDENSTLAFHYSTTDIPKETKLGMIPYAIDIPIFLSQDLKQNISSRPKIEDLTSIVLLNKKTLKDIRYFPIGFGIDNISLELLKKGVNVFEGYENSLQIMFDLIGKTGNINLLKSLQQFGDEKDTLYQTYSFSGINNWVNAFSKAKSDQFPSCKNYKSLCLLQSKKTNLVFGTLSDLDILESKFNIKDIQVNPFFQTSTSYPSVTWYLMIRKDLTPTKQAIAIKYIKTYMDIANDGNTNFWNNTIPAINNALNNQSYKEQYQNIRNSLGSIYEVRGKLDSVKNIVNNKDMENFLKTGNGANDAMKVLIDD